MTHTHQSYDPLDPWQTGYWDGMRGAARNPDPCWSNQEWAEYQQGYQVGFETAGEDAFEACEMLKEDEL